MSRTHWTHSRSRAFSEAVSRLDRRSFLKAGSSLAGGLSLRCAGEEPARPAKAIAVDALVVGSGFGGAVAALRLGEAGLQTVVLERGRRWDVSPKFDTFCTIEGIDERAAWLSDRVKLPGVGVVRLKRYLGLLEASQGENTTVFSAAGVGGGSLVYGCVLVRPTRDGLYRSLPTDIDYDELVDTYYPRALEMLGASPIPGDILARDEFALSRLALQQAEASGLELERVASGVDWSVVRDELDGNVPAAIIRGDYLFFGTNSGAKNSVDRNYLLRAELTGNVAIHAQHQVQRIERVREGYRVFAEHLADDGSVLDMSEYRAERLFLGAGSLGTTKLLSKAKALGLLPNLSDDLGKSWGTNGDQTIMRVMAGEVGAAQAGPPVVMVTDEGGSEDPSSLQYFPSHLPFECGCATALRMRAGNQLGELQYDSGNDTMVPFWSEAENNPQSPANVALEGHLDAATPGTSSVPLPPATDFPHTYHPLGGAVMGRVCDSIGRVYEYPNLYVVDGSLIAGYCGARNPALTITALVERNVERILREDVLES